jgi:hypothetical protein
MGNPFNGTRVIADINGNSGTVTPIYGTGPVTKLVIRESIFTAGGSNNSPQGMQYQLPGSTQWIPVPAPSTTNEPGDFPKIAIPDDSDYGYHAHERFVIGMGPDSPGAGVAPSVNGTLLLNIKSLTGSGTSVQVDQIY